MEWISALSLRSFKTIWKILNNCFNVISLCLHWLWFLFFISFWVLLNYYWLPESWGWYDWLFELLRYGLIGIIYASRWISWLSLITVNLHFLNCIPFGGCSLSNGTDYTIIMLKLDHHVADMIIVISFFIFLVQIFPTWVQD